MKLPMMPRQLLVQATELGHGGLVCWKDFGRSLSVPLKLQPLTLNAAKEMSLYVALAPVPVTLSKTGSRAVTSLPAVMSAAHFCRTPSHTMPG